MKNFLLIDGNSIMNRAFYGIMSTNIMRNKEGKYELKYEAEDSSGNKGEYDFILNIEF